MSTKWISLQGTEFLEALTKMKKRGGRSAKSLKQNLILQCLVSTNWSCILKQTCNWKWHVQPATESDKYVWPFSEHPALTA